MVQLLKPNVRSFYLLNATQFLGALNDNMFKLLVIYLLINVMGPAAAPRILSLAGAIFVIPFLLFSSGSGVIADRISKRTVIVFTKVMEVVTMLFGMLAVYLESSGASYTVLFFMATQSAIFGPSKYGIIPELVESNKVSKANGSMTSFTYLAIILGTFLASFLTDVSDKNFLFVSSVCVLIAILGLLTSFGIMKTAPQNSSKKINPFFLYEIYQTLKVSWKVPHLLPAIFGSAFFLFIGAFTQLNIIPFAMQSLHLSEVGGGYLFLATAVGIAVGAVLAGQVSKDKVEPGLSCICGFIISICFLLLFFFSFSLWCTIIFLALLGVFGGGFLIPFDSFIQVSSPDEKRGQVIAASSFFSFVGVLFSAFFLFAISEELGFTASSGFAFMGILTFIASVIITGRVACLFFPFFVRKILKRFRSLEITSELPSADAILLLQSGSMWDAILLTAQIPNLKILVPGSFFRTFPWINGWIESFAVIPTDPEPRHVKRLLKKRRRYSYCLFFNKYEQTQELLQIYEQLFRQQGAAVFVAHGKKERSIKKFMLFKIPFKKITIYFEKD